MSLFIWKQRSPSFYLTRSSEFWNNLLNCLLLSLIYWISVVMWTSDIQNDLEKFEKGEEQILIQNLEWTTLTGLALKSDGSSTPTWTSETDQNHIQSLKNVVLHMWRRCRDNQTDVPQPVIKSTSGCLNLNHMFRSFPDSYWFRENLKLFSLMKLLQVSVSCEHLYS